MSEHYTDVDVEKAAQQVNRVRGLRPSGQEIAIAVLDAVAPDIARAAEARGAEKALREAADEWQGSIQVMEALEQALRDHITTVEADGPDGPYIWCTCEWRSDDVLPNDNPGNSANVHMLNVLHAATVPAIQARLHKRANLLSADRGSENRSTDSRLFLQSTVRAASEPDDRTPHQHGGTDAPECTRYGVACAPEARPTVADLGVPTSFREQAVRPTTAEQIDAALEAAAQAIEAALLDGGDGSVGGDTAARIVRAQKRGTP